MNGPEAEAAPVLPRRGLGLPRAVEGASQRVQGRHKVAPGPEVLHQLRHLRRTIVVSQLGLKALAREAATLPGAHEAMRTGRVAVTDHINQRKAALQGQSHMHANRASQRQEATP